VKHGGGVGGRAAARADVRRAERAVVPRGTPHHLLECAARAEHPGDELFAGAVQAIDQEHAARHAEAAAGRGLGRLGKSLTQRPRRRGGIGLDAGGGGHLRHHLVRRHDEGGQMAAGQPSLRDFSRGGAAEEGGAGGGLLGRGQGRGQVVLGRGEDQPEARVGVAERPEGHADGFGGRRPGIDLQRTAAARNRSHRRRPFGLRRGGRRTIPSSTRGLACSASRHSQPPPCLALGVRR
jgi:hypothetical protein